MQALGKRKSTKGMNRHMKKYAKTVILNLREKTTTGNLKKNKLLIYIKYFVN
jgi:hypothetical protein